MSANESELPANPENGMIDSIYEDFQAIIDGLPCGPESPVERYGFDNATEFINYVQNELEVGETDIQRVLSEYENEHCPFCELEGETDPTMHKTLGAETRDSYKVGVDQVVEGFFEADCGDPEHDVFFRYEETWES